MKSIELKEITKHENMVCPTGVNLSISRFGFRRNPNRTIRFLHLLFQVLAHLFPGPFHQRDGTPPLPFAIIDSRAGATPSEPLAGVMTTAGMMFDRGTFPLAGTCILPCRSATPQPLAFIQSTAEMLLGTGTNRYGFRP